MGDFRMTLIYSGKTKDVYDNQNGTYTMKFKDDATGKDGVFDPGENQVGLTIDGLGRESLTLTQYFFKKIADAGIPTCYISADLDKAEMVVKPAINVGGLGKGLEVICRMRATGSFVRRYGSYVVEGAPLDNLVEITVKDDERGDPLITKDSIIQLGLMNETEYETIIKYTKQIAAILKSDMAIKGLELYDMKFEFGRTNDGEIVLSDEISAGCLRVYKNGKIVQPMELRGLVLA